MADLRFKDLDEAATPGADYWVPTDSATDGVKKIKPSNLVSKADIGLGDVNNTSDADKPISTATQTALDGKATSAQGAKADTAVQPDDLGDLATKDKIQAADIDAVGTPNGSSFYRGDGVWATPAGGGDMSTVFYDSEGFTADAFGGRVSFPTVSDADAAIVGAAPLQIVTPFFDSSTTPGSSVEFVEAGTPDPSSPGQIDITANGVTTFYTRSNLVLRAEQFGCKSGGTPSVNRAALLEMFQLADLTGRTIDLGTSDKTFVIPSGISYTWLHNKPIIRGSGATIKLDKAGGAVSATTLYFGYDQLGFDLEGFNVDANYDAPRALELVNTNSSAYNAATIKDGRIVGVGGHRGYTRTSVEGGTRGIGITGWLRRLVAHDLMVDEVKIATGAYNINYSTAGIYIGRDVNGAYPIFKDISNPFVGKVWSEDSAQVLNMDGIMLFDAIPASAIVRPSGATTIRGGMLRDCMGRGVKIQASNVDIFGLSGELNTAPTGGQTESFIDFQFGGGNVYGGSLLCNGYSPKNVFISQAFAYAAGQTTINGFQYFGAVGTAEPDSLAWRYANASARSDGGLVVRDCHTRVIGVKNIARFGSRAASVVTERASVMGNSASVSAACVAFEFFGSEELAATIKDNICLSTSLFPLYTRKDTSGTAVANTVSVSGATTDNWYFSAGT